jgi:SAM-dependent methyltransferase
MADKPPVALEARDDGGDGRRYSPSTARNREAICDAMATWLKGPISLLEIASGTGEHGAFLTQELLDLNWTYSDIDPEGLSSQAAWRRADTTGRLSGPLTIDASTDHWGEAELPAHWDAIFSANMVHIAPWNAAEGLLRGAGRLLKPGGLLMLYGPFARAGVMAPSNAAFDGSLKSRNARWGVRDLDRALLPLAEKAGLGLENVVQMPANNLTTFFRKVQDSGFQSSVS